MDEYLYGVDNNWYAYDFDKETFTYFTDYVLNQPADRLMWGAGGVVGHEDLFDVIHAVQDKAGTEGADYTEEIAALKAAEARQAQLLGPAWFRRRSPLWRSSPAQLTGWPHTNNKKNSHPTTGWLFFCLLCKQERIRLPESRNKRRKSLFNEKGGQGALSFFWEG